MYREELSKLANGEFKITTEIPTAGQNVKQAYYIDADGNLQTLAFSQDGDNVTVEMTTLSMYTIALEYGDADTSVDDGNQGGNTGNTDIDNTGGNDVTNDNAAANGAGTDAESVQTGDYFDFVLYVVVALIAAAMIAAIAVIRRKNAKADR